MSGNTASAAGGRYSEQALAQRSKFVAAPRRNKFWVPQEGLQATSSPSAPATDSSQILCFKGFANFSLFLRFSVALLFCCFFSYFHLILGRFCGRICGGFGTKKGTPMVPSPLYGNAIYTPLFVFPFQMNIDYALKSTNLCRSISETNFVFPFVSSYNLES